MDRGGAREGQELGAGAFCRMQLLRMHPRDRGFVQSRRSKPKRGLTQRGNQR